MTAEVTCLYGIALLRSGNRSGIAHLHKGFSVLSAALGPEHPKTLAVAAQLLVFGVSTI